jgi:hypothetical protein
VVILFTLLLCNPQTCNAGEVSDSVINRFLPALARVESNNNPKAVGDNGAAIGMYQIHRCYWQDAIEFDKTLGGRYEDCFDPEYAERVVRAYLKRYAPADATVEQLARIHNGGCNILKKQHSKKAKDKKAWDNTTKYWNKIKDANH